MDTLAKGRATVLHVVTLPTIPSDSFDGEIGISRSNLTVITYSIYKHTGCTMTKKEKQCETLNDGFASYDKVGIVQSILNSFVDGQIR